MVEEENNDGESIEKDVEYAWTYNIYGELIGFINSTIGFCGLFCTGFVTVLFELLLLFECVWLLASPLPK